jgi:hypothetical protein
MLARCYYEKNRPTYVNAEVVEEWWKLSNFKAWMEIQDWEGKELDKDLLIKGNKIYGPDTCIFITSQVNLFIVELNKGVDELPLGVQKHRNAFTAAIGVDGKRIHIGSYKTIEEAENAFLEAKKAQALVLAGKQDCPRVSEAIIKKYA